MNVVAWLAAGVKICHRIWLVVHHGKERSRSETSKNQTFDVSQQAHRASSAVQTMDLWNENEECDARSTETVSYN